MCPKGLEGSNPSLGTHLRRTLKKESVCVYTDHMITPEQQNLLQQVAEEVKSRLVEAESGHDWWHIVRVRNTAQQLAQAEGADEFLVDLGALLHDIADWKFHAGDDTQGSVVTHELLGKLGVEKNIVEQVAQIVDHVSYKGAGVETPQLSVEGKVVQDADRLDALGAIGIARAFAYGGFRNRPMYDPDHKPTLHKTKQEYFQNKGTTINHFYEKLLLLKDRMNTQAGKQLAAERHRFLEEFLDRFYTEWEGKA